MKTNSILSVPVVLLKIAMSITIIMATLITFSLIHSGYSPATYNKVTIQDRGFSMNFSSSSNDQQQPQSRVEYIEKGDDAIYLNRLTFPSKLRIWLQAISILVIYFLIMRELLSFISNVKTYSTFFINCSQTFKRLKIYLVILVIISFVVSVVHFDNTMLFPDGVIQNLNSTYDINLDSSFHYIISLLVLMILDRVFKEGERMKKENDLTI